MEARSSKAESKSCGFDLDGHPAKRFFAGKQEREKDLEKIG